MAQLSHEAIEEFKAVWKKDYGQELTDAQASEAANNLVNFFEILIKLDAKDRARKLKLKDSPKGFPIDDDGVYSCFVCCTSITTANGWYDKYGLKCLDCQRAVENKIFPPIIFKDRDSWFTMWHLESRYKLHSATIRKMVRDEKLKARIVTYESGKPHYYIFLVKENLEFLKELASKMPNEENNSVEANNG